MWRIGRDTTACRGAVAPGPAARRSYAGRVDAGLLDEIDGLVTGWLTLPEAAERLGADLGGVRRLLRDRYLVAVRRGRPTQPCVPEDLIADGEPLPDLPGTLTVLRDAGFDDLEALRWLLTEDETLPGSPLQALRAGRKTEIRRRAQAMAF